MTFFTNSFWCRPRNSRQFLNIARIRTFSDEYNEYTKLVEKTRLDNRVLKTWMYVASGAGLGLIMSYYWRRP